MKKILWLLAIHLIATSGVVSAADVTLTVDYNTVVRTINLPGGIGTMDVKLIPHDPYARAFTAGMFDGLVYLVDTRRGTAHPPYMRTPLRETLAVGAWRRRRGCRRRRRWWRAGAVAFPCLRAPRCWAKPGNLSEPRISEQLPRCSHGVDAGCRRPLQRAPLPIWGARSLVTRHARGTGLGASARWCCGEEMLDPARTCGPDARCHSQSGNAV